MVVDGMYFANLVVAASAIVTLLLNAYVAWGNGRDKKVEALGSIRGLASELSMRCLYLKDNPSPTEPEMHIIQEAAENIANRLAEKVGEASGFIGQEATTRAAVFAGNLYRLRKLQLSATPTTDERRKFDGQLKDLLKEAGEFQSFVGIDIEKHWKLRNYLQERLGRLL